MPVKHGTLWPEVKTDPRGRDSLCPANCFQSDWQLRGSCWHRLVIPLKISLYVSHLRLRESMFSSMCLRHDLCSLALRCKLEMSAFAMVAFEFLHNSFGPSVASLATGLFFFIKNILFPSHEWRLILFDFFLMEAWDTTHSSCFLFVFRYKFPLHLTH